LPLSLAPTDGQGVEQGTTASHVEQAREFAFAHRSATAYVERLQLLQKTLDRAKSQDSDQLRQAGVAHVLDAAIGVLLDLQTELTQPEEEIHAVRTVIAECQRSLEGIARRQQEEYAKKLRDYQAWALGMICHFDSYDGRGWRYDAAHSRIEGALTSFKSPQGDMTWDLLQEFPAAKPLLEQKIGLKLNDVRDARLTVAQQKRIFQAADGGRFGGWKNSVNTELAYLATREAIIQWPLPINVSLLDPPVAQLYQKAFAKGWERLEGRSDQLEGAKAAARVVKLTVEEAASRP
jgi:hypothetical protein